jgi:F0F1-type ATP synthase gamma subunit
MYIHLHVKYPLFFSDFNQNFLNQFSKNPQISNFMKIHPVAAELFDVDRQTDMMKLRVAFCNFANVANNSTRRHK